MPCTTRVLLDRFEWSLASIAPGTIAASESSAAPFWSRASTRRPPIVAVRHRARSALAPRAGVPFDRGR
jgi:hypothetical protein